MLYLLSPCICTLVLFLSFSQGKQGNCWNLVCTHWLLSLYFSRSTYSTVNSWSLMSTLNAPCRVKIIQADLWMTKYCSLVNNAPLPAAQQSTVLVSNTTSEATHSVQDRLLASQRTGTNSGFALSLEGLDRAKQVKACWFSPMATDYSHDTDGLVFGSDLHVWAKRLTALNKCDWLIPTLSWLFLSKEEEYLSTSLKFVSTHLTTLHWVRLVH